MPLYDCMLLLKPHVSKEGLIDLMTKVGKHVYRRNGVITDLKVFGSIELGYGIKKLDGRHYQGQLTQMTMMTPPSFNKELHYLNKEDRLLRWLLIKHRDFKFGSDIWGEDDLMRPGFSLGKDDTMRVDDPMRGDFGDYRIILNEPDEGGGAFSKGSSDDDDDDEDEDKDDYSRDLKVPTLKEW